ncbi:hypothetical protein [Sphingosinicella sp. BN140058]|uniref:hypothetical protein n=1 Tax=Sphingosinicella sp. BN140058 TaxID=1892855 RepID=UPI0010111B16|nr:hypothetical protein [Sphingosinicella sp. BN140058]QAY78282.1 hypothetical protein ETR14_18375 [Sphingosinicella sp. BN140058]
MSKKSKGDVAGSDAGETGGVPAMAAAGPPPLPRLLAARESAEVEARIGGFGFHARAEISPAGLLAIGGLVGTILLSTAVVVRAARR